MTIQQRGITYNKINHKEFLSMSHLDHEYRKVKTAPKFMLPANQKLKLKIAETVSLIADLVGSTLGPNGRTVLIERGEPGLPPFQTKDGVTVVRSLAFNDPVKQVILESFRESAIRTVEAAGDGTTTATILANAILKHMDKYLIDNPKVSPQAALREITDYFNAECVPYIKKSSLKIKNENSKDLLYKVAKLSANGDSKLAGCVLEAFDLVGDSGHITLVEEPGVDGFDVQKADGYPFDKGFEESLGIFSNEFINDHDNNRVYLENPHILLIDGKVLELNNLISLLNELENEYQKKTISPNVIIVAHGFSKEIIVKLAQFFKLPNALKILPCVTPIDMLANSQYEFLRDIAAFTGGQIYNSVSNPLHLATLEGLGQPANAFEMNRNRSIIHGLGKEETVIERVRQLKSQMVGATKLTKNILEERAGRLSGGIAKIIIRGVSDSQNREVKDRAEDAICAIRGALKHGVLPGGGKILLNLSILATDSESKIVKDVLSLALREPLIMLLKNCGMNEFETEEVILELIQEPNKVYDALRSIYGDPIDLGILDSAPAVMESLRSAIGIAALLATCGGVVVFGRDESLELQETMNYNQKSRDLSEYEGNDSTAEVPT